MLSPPKPPPLARTLKALEVPDCRCPMWVPRCVANGTPCAGECRCIDVIRPFHMACRHVRGADHAMHWDCWRALIPRSAPAEYAEPPPPPRRHRAVTREDRVRVYARRHKAGYGLWHPDDLRCEHDTRAVPLQHTSRNGAAREGGVVLTPGFRGTRGPRKSFREPQRAHA